MIIAIQFVTLLYGEYKLESVYLVVFTKIVSSADIILSLIRIVLALCVIAERGSQKLKKICFLPRPFVDSRGYDL